MKSRKIKDEEASIVSPSLKSRRSEVTSKGFQHSNKQAHSHAILRQMGWPGPSTCLPEDFVTWLVVLVDLSS